MDLANIHNSNVKMAEHWRKLYGLLHEKKYIEELQKRTNQDRIQLEQKAATKIQVWWRRIRRRKMFKHIERICVQEFWDAPCSEENRNDGQMEANQDGFQNEKVAANPEDGQNEMGANPEDGQNEKKENPDELQIEEETETNSAEDGQNEENQNQSEIQIGEEANPEDSQNENQDGFQFEKEANPTEDGQNEKEVNPEDGQNEENQEADNIEKENSKDDRIEATLNEVQIEEKAITKIQAWWRGIHYRQRKMLPEHKEKLRICVQEFRNVPCSEENPKDERNEPLNLRIERYLACLLSTVLTERKAMALRLNRLAEISHVAIECMLRRNIFQAILNCLSELNRSEAHLYVIRPLSALIIKLLSQKPLVEPFALDNLDGLLSNAINLIHKNYKDAEVVRDQTIALEQLSIYPGFAEKMVALRFDWYMQKFKCLERFNQQKDDPRLLAYKRLCELNKLINAAQTPNDA